jgi:hypothetical protein
VKRGYTCRCCGKYHAELPLHYGAEAPVYWFGIPARQRKRRCVLSSDQCIIDDEHFYILGNLEIPVIGSKEKFSWGVWVSLSAQNFARACDL